MATKADLERYRRNLQDEVDSAYQYHTLAQLEKLPELSQVYENLAKMEEKHAAFWEARLKNEGTPIPLRQPSWRSRIMVWIAKHVSKQLVVASLAEGEKADQNMYVPQAETQGTSMTSEEHLHTTVLQEILKVHPPKGLEGGLFARLETGHRAGGGNALRAAVLGANDGLCSNLSLVMGVAGAEVHGHALLITGIAGLLAGACSMALGEWVSVTSARELAEREIRVEADELEAFPEQESEELELIYQAKGLSSQDAKKLAGQLLSNKATALDTLVREELGINPKELSGSANEAAFTSFLLFALGALIPVFPFFFTEGYHGVLLSVILSSVALFSVGAIITLFTGKSALVSGLRQLVFGLAAAAITYGIGKLIGVAIS